MQKENPEEIATTILDLVTQRIPNRFAKDPINDIQVLTPMHKGIIGAQNLNQALQEALNKSQTELSAEAGGFTNWATKLCRSRMTTIRKFSTGISEE